MFDSKLSERIEKVAPVTDGDGVRAEEDAKPLDDASLAARTRESRARLSRGTSSDPIYKMVADAIRAKAMTGTLVDVGCGNAELHPFLSESISRYIGVDIVRHDQFPIDLELVFADLDVEKAPLESSIADIVVSVETIEHVENPRSFARELVRLARPGGWVMITTPNQLSLLSKLTLVIKNQFNAFQDTSYPAHLTALLEIDLVRICAECGLLDSEIRYSNCGRIPGTSRRWPFALHGRAFSDNLMIVARKPVTAESATQGDLNN